MNINTITVKGINSLLYEILYRITWNVLYISQSIHVCNKIFMLKKKKLKIFHLNYLNYILY